MEGLIKAGGVFCMVLVVFHLLFWKIFDWDNELRKLNGLNRAIMQVLNLSLTFVFVIVAWISFVHTQALLTTDLGTSLLTSICLLWLFRAVLQPVFFKLRHWLSWAFLVYFMGGAGIYGIPLLR